MGNKTSSCSVSDKEEELSDYDMTIYKLRKERIFWGTLAICITYALIALILFLASYFSENVKAILLNRFFPFTLVFIIGTIAITIYLTYQVLDFRPVKINRNNNYDNLSCPDYWRLEKIPLDDNDPSSKQLFDGINPGLFRYRCVMDTSIFNKGDIAKTNLMRLSGQGAAADLISPQATVQNPNSPNNYLYANLTIPANNQAFYKDIANSNLSPLELTKHDLIMNNFTLINSNDTSGALKFKYNIDTPESRNAANKLKIAPLDNKISGFDVSTNKYLNITTNDTTKTPIVKSGASSIAAETGTTLTNLPLTCDRVYPLYLASKDVELSKDNNKLDQNVLRCAYSKICGVPWSDLNCEKYTYK